MMQWLQQAAELQTLRAHAENRKKVGDNFYKMDEESFVTIREELSDDFFSLAESHLGASDENRKQGHICKYVPMCLLRLYL